MQSRIDRDSRPVRATAPRVRCICAALLSRLVANPLHVRRVPGASAARRRRVGGASLARSRRFTGASQVRAATLALGSAVTTLNCVNFVNLAVN